MTSFAELLQQDILAMFPDRYALGEDVASIWRVYVRKDLRGNGLGRWLTALCEREATRLRYRTMYLHATSDAHATVSFWPAVGNRIIDANAETTHFDKRLGATAENLWNAFESVRSAAAAA